MAAWTLVRATFSASHRDGRGRAGLHGHSYEVTVAYPVGDALDLQAELVRYLGDHFDHRILPPALATAEAMAAEIGLAFRQSVWVEIWRPLERLGARWER